MDIAVPFFSSEDSPQLANNWMSDTKNICSKSSWNTFARINETLGCFNWKVSCSVFSINGRLFFEVTLQLINKVFALCALHYACQSISTPNNAPALGSHHQAVLEDHCPPARHCELKDLGQGISSDWKTRGEMILSLANTIPRKLMSPCIATVFKHLHEHCTSTTPIIGIQPIPCTTKKKLWISLNQQLVRRNKPHNVPWFVKKNSPRNPDGRPTLW